jgi:DNA repair protein RecO (recombination protein O)
MNEAQIIENFYDLRIDVASLALAAYLSEIAGIICVVENEDDGGILRLLLNSLHLLSNKKLPRKIIKAVFELRVLTKSGFMPNLEECEICLQKYKKYNNENNINNVNNNHSDIIFFDVIGGNLVCTDCVGKIDKNNPAKLLRISRDVLSAMKFITSVRDEKLFSFVLHEDIENEFTNICEKYLLAQINMNIDSLKHYKNYDK